MTNNEFLRLGTFENESGITDAKRNNIWFQVILAVWASEAPMGWSHRIIEHLKSNARNNGFDTTFIPID